MNNICLFVWCLTARQHMQQPSSMSFSLIDKQCNAYVRLHGPEWLKMQAIVHEGQPKNQQLTAKYTQFAKFILVPKTRSYYKL